MSEFTHASIVPLIGGETIGSHRAFGSKPIHFMSYEAFANNDKHILNYYNNEIPYHVLDAGGSLPEQKADVVSSVCPCAGLSMMSHGYGDDNQNNKWMIETANLMLGEYKPKVFWGENAPGFAGKIGKNVREQLRAIGKENGYTMSVYRTRSLLHGVPQVRERSFYFFWKDTNGRVPIFNYYDREYTPIEEVIRNAGKSNFQTDPINKKKPSENPYYRYILEEIEGGKSHTDHSHDIDPTPARGVDAFSYIERAGHNYLQVAEWMEKNGYDNEVEKCKYKYEKLDKGGSIMRRGVIVPKDRIGAFVGHYPTMLTHPDEDRFINYREAMSIMGLPEDFELVDASPKVANHICQNVPVQTAQDMATEVLKYLNGELEMVDSEYVLQYNTTKKIEFDQPANTLEGFFNG